MKWLVASDIHGSKTSAEQIRDAFIKTGAEKILLLGDILYHGPRNSLPEDYSPKEVCSILNPISQSIIALRGNCDCEVDQMVLSFDVTTESMYLSNGSWLCYACHGHKLESQKNLLSPETILLHGHTHIPTCKKEEGIIILNPGSISMPKENHPKTFALLEDSLFSVWKAENFSHYMSIAL